MAQINIANSGTSGIETPQSGVVAVFSNSADSGKLYYKFSDGTISPVNTGSTSGGDSGTSGTSGAAGDSGTSGTSGEAGTSGTTGDSGTSGTSGTGSGDSGTSGTSGEAGTSGTSGTGSGDSGTSGTTGADGTSGTSGADGTSGTNGEDGTSGTSGVSGGAGTSGTDGDSGTSGTAGDSGTSGTAGDSGTSGTTGDSGTAGTSGTSGDEGTSGTSGDGTSGTSSEGTSGTSGNDGTSGTGGAGTSGTSGADGTSGTGVTGTSGTSGEGTSGTSGAAGAAGTSGTSGAGGGGGGVSTVYNGVVRAYVDHGSNRTSEILSAGTVYGGLTWSRSSTTLTITSTSHGLTTGDYIVIRNMSEDYSLVSVTATDGDTLTCTVANSGGTSGTEGAYIPVPIVDTGATVSDDEMTITSPSAGTVQIISVRITTGTKSGTTFTLKMPQSLSNGGGANNSIITMNPPTVGVYKLSDGAFVNTSYIANLNTSSNFNEFTVGSIPSLVNIAIKFNF